MLASRGTNSTESCPSLQVAKKDASDVSVKGDSEGENEAEEKEEDDEADEE